MRGEGEADDAFAVNLDDAAAEAALLVAGKFEGGVDAENVELTACGVEEGFGFGEFLDRDDARVERGGWLEWARGGDAEAQRVASDVEALAGEWEYVGVTVSGYAET